MLAGEVGLFIVLDFTWSFLRSGYESGKALIFLDYSQLMGDLRIVSQTVDKST